MASFLRLLPLVLVSVIPFHSVLAQEACQPLSQSATAREPNIFTPQQEVFLGDAIAEHLQRNFRVIEDEEVTAHLRHIGDRLVGRFAPKDLKFQFFLFDLPTANAFALSGGRIYVSRKMVAFARTEDELAAVLAHEVGHILTHQTAIEMTRYFRELLGVTTVADRKDIFEKYNQFVENMARKPRMFEQRRNQEQQNQIAADQSGLFTLAVAGYDPQIYASFWDRFAETHAKAGNWFMDLFGTTKPESRRLREAIKGLSSIPQTCISSRSTTSSDDFQTWQAAIINYGGLGRKESLHSVNSKRVLDPPLRGDISHFRFSPDGNYVLAQDDSSIFVLTREPWAPKFRIDAPEAFPAQFTQDSKNIIFYTPSLRVETWNVEDEQRTSVHEVVIRKNCVQTALAPDGKSLACFDSALGLYLYEVPTGLPILQKKDFYQITHLLEVLIWRIVVILGEGQPDFMNMGFSPDARYFVAGRNDFTIAFDLTTRTQVQVHGPIKKFIGSTFTFLAPDRLVGTDPGNPKKSALVSFPSGEIISELSLGRASLSPPAHGNYILIRPIEKYAVGVMDLGTKKIFMANKLGAIDLYDQVFVCERRNGEVGLYRIENNERLANVLLPRGPLGRLRATAVSQDLTWLALSERSRGAVWNLTRGERVFNVRGFRGAYFSDDGAVYADFPKFEQTERSIARLDLAQRQASEGPKIDESGKIQHGPFLLYVKSAKKDGLTSENVIVDVLDARTSATLWSRPFPKEAPEIVVDPREETMVLFWLATASHVRSIIKSDPALTQRLAALKEKEGDYFVQVLNVRTGAILGSLFIETGKGSFRLIHGFAAGDSVVLLDSENRVLVYSLSSGEQKGKVFGGSAVASKATGLLSVENERGQLDLYDLSTLEKRDQFVFSSPVSLTQFSADGKRLFVLTANQTTYLLDVSSLPNSSAASSSPH